MPSTSNEARSVALRSAAALAQAGLIESDDQKVIESVAERYAIAITPVIRQQIVDAVDAVGLQFVPSPLELNTTADELADPISDQPFSPVPGVIHRYEDRVLLKPLHVCPVYCRFCFRREVVGPGQGVLSEPELARALDYIRHRPEVWEVILTGGDPLLLSPARMDRIVSALDEMKHVEVIRIHTRVPVVDPGRITQDLTRVLKRSTPVWIVLHCN